MINKLFLFLFLLAAAGSARAQSVEPPTGGPGDSVVYRAAVHFPKNEGEWVPRSEYKAVGRILRWAQANTDVPIVITGWSDESGTAAFNVKLSLRRARTVRNYLVQKGIASERITFEGRGVDTAAESPEKARRADVCGVIRLAVQTFPIGGGQPATAACEPEPRPAAGQVVPQEAQNPVPEIADMPRQNGNGTAGTAARPEQTPQPEQASAIPGNPTPEPGRYLGVKTNLAAWAGTIMNIAADVQVGKHISIELPVLWCPWYAGSQHAVKTFTVQPEARWWLSKPGAGHFFGLHAHVGWFNVKWNKDRYQDAGRPLLGAGISYGYLLPFGKHWAGEFTIGAGYANMKYDTYYNIGNGARIDTRTKNYWGITRVGVSVVYRFNLKK